MANWKYVVDLSEEWKKVEAEAISPAELACSVAAKLEALPCYEADDDLQEVVEKFKDIGRDVEGCTLNDIDAVYDELCDWGDQRVTLGGNGRMPTNMCWIKTF